MSKNSKFLKGAIFGAIAGAAAGILFAPKSGKETREDIKKKAGEIKESAEKAYAKAKASVERKVAELKKVGETLSKEKYEEIVSTVMDEMKNDKEVSKEAATKLKAQLKKDYDKVAKALKA